MNGRVDPSSELPALVAGNTTIPTRPKGRTYPMTLRVLCVSGRGCLLLLVLGFGSGCEGDSPRGAGSIDIPKESLQRYTYSKTTPAPNLGAGRPRSPVR
jgi:hypothetical protein